MKNNLYKLSRSRQSGTALRLIVMMILLCLFLPACNETPQEAFHHLDKQGDEYFSAHNYRKAIEMWNAALAIKPEALAVYQKIGDCYHKMAKYNQALQAYNKKIQLRPEDWQARFKIAKIQLALMNLSAAEENWDKVKTRINNTDSLIFHSDLLSLQNRYSDAEHEYRQALEKEPHNQTAMIRLAICLAAQKKTTDAEKVFSSLLNLTPQSADILLQMSNFCSINGKEQAAEAFINKAMKMEPHNHHLQMKLARLQLETKRYNLAITVLQNLLNTMPDNRYAEKMLIEALLFDNRYQEAGQRLNNLTKTELKDLDFQLLQGKYYLNTLQFQTAIAQFQTILDLEPEIPLAHYFIGLAYLAAGMTNLGQQSLVKCLSLNPDFTQAELALADIYFKRGNYLLALKHVERIKKREPENYRGYLLAGNIHLALHEYQEAMADYQDAQYLNPGSILPPYHKARSISLLKETKDLLNYYQKLLVKNPKLTDVALQYSHELAKDGQIAKATKFLQQAISNQPTNPYLYNILGEVYLAGNNKKEAIKSFTVAIANQPKMKSVYLKLFQLYANNEEQLEKFLITAINQNHDFYQAYTQLADLYVRKDLPSKAIKTLKQGIEKNPKNPYLNNNLALLYIKQQPQNIDKAIGLAQTAYENLPDNPAVTDTLGWVYYKKNMLTRAAWLFEQAKKLDPNNPIINNHFETVQKALEKNREG